MQSYPFTSQVTYDEQGMPLYDRAVDSEFLRSVNKQYYSDGVFYDQSDRLQVVADTGMQVKVNPGCCHIQGAIGIEPYQRTLVVQAAGDQDRIDTVVARLDLSLAVRRIDLYVVKGTPAESPQAPALTRDSTTWELGLANLFVARNTATISQQRITDTRLDNSRCGQVGATVQPPFDTDAYFAQLTAAITQHQQDAEAQIKQLSEAIAAVEGDTAWMMKDLYDPEGLGIDATVQTYVHSKIGTAHDFAGSGANGRALMTADVQPGDTWTVNGKPVTAYMGAENASKAMAGRAFNGKWITFVSNDDVLSIQGGSVREPQLLWTNPAPTEEFAAQSVESTIDVSKFTHLDIDVTIYTRSQFGTVSRCTIRVPVSEYQGALVSGSTVNDVSVYRRFVQASGTSITFTTGQAGTEADRPDVMVPWRVWGVKM